MADTERKSPAGVQLAAEEVDAWAMAAINTVGAANRAVNLAEALGIDKLFRIGKDEE
ncbi:hypothetical protein ACH4Q6_30090 [Streptomyces lydicus]|uniref:hypothetical protein n=1 Tax=Streptomyces lydicus TaxID=47763 RepID=UPI0037B65F10